MMYNLIKFSCV